MFLKFDTATGDFVKLAGLHPEPLCGGLGINQDYFLYFQLVDLKPTNHWIKTVTFYDKAFWKLEGNGFILITLIYILLVTLNFSNFK